MDPGGEVWPSATETGVDRSYEIPPRFRALPVRQLLGIEFPIAVGIVIRLRGLAFLDRSRAGPGLLIPRCRSIHTFGMRFPLTVVFLDREGDHLAIHSEVPPGRMLSDRRARAVLEVALPLALDWPSTEEALNGGGRDFRARD
jgi:uncharacterized membrane protein (UPF0127 family)